MPGSSIDPIADPIVEAVTRAVTSMAASWDPAYAGATLTPPSITRYRQSFVLRYDVAPAAPGRVPLLVKIARRAEMLVPAEAVASERLHVFGRQEYLALKAVADAVAAADDERLCAVRPLHYLSEWNAIVMQEITFRSLKDLTERPIMVMGRASDWLPVERAYELAARWLRMYHQEVGNPQLQPLEQTDTMLDTVEAIDRLQQSLGSSADVEWLRVATAAAYDRCRALSTQVAHIHGDFHGGNIMIDLNDRVGSLDISARDRTLPVERDLTTLLTELDTSKLQTLTCGRFVRSSWRTRCRDAMIRGYYADTVHQPALIEFFSALAIIKRWVAREDDAQRRRGWKRQASRPALFLMRCYFPRVVRRHLAAAAA